MRDKVVKHLDSNIMMHSCYSFEHMKQVLCDTCIACRHGLQGSDLFSFLVSSYRLRITAIWRNDNVTCHSVPCQDLLLLQT